MTARAARRHRARRTWRRCAAPLGALDARRRRGSSGWGARLAGVLRGGGRLLAAGQRRQRGAGPAPHRRARRALPRDRPPFSAIALHAETSSLTAIANDYGAEEVFARQVRAHGRPGDVLVALSTSGRSPNVLRRGAAGARGRAGRPWALTGPAPNPLAALCDDAVASTRRRRPPCRRSTWSRSTCSAPRSTARVARRRGDRRGARVRRRPWSSSATRCSTATSTGASSGSAPTRPVPVVDDPEGTAAPGGAGLAAALAAAGGRRRDARDGAGRRRRRAGELAGAARRRRGRRRRPRPRGRDARRSPRARRRAARSCASTAAATARRVGAAAAARRARARRQPPRCSSPTTAAASRPSPACARRSTARRAGAPVVWDPHPRGAEPVPGVPLVTPNAAEAARLAPASPRAADAAAEHARPRRCDAGGRGAVVRDPRRARRAARRAAAAPRSPFRPPAVAGGRPVRRRATASPPPPPAALADGALPVARPSEAAVGAPRAGVAAGGAGAGGRAAPAPIAAPGGARPAPWREARASGPRRHGRGHGRLLRPAPRRPRALLEAARALGDCLVVLPQLRRLRAAAQGRRPPARRRGRPRRGAARRWAASTPSLVFDEDTPRARAARGCGPTSGSRAATTRVAELPEAASLASWGGRVAPALRRRALHHRAHRGGRARAAG